MVGSLRRLWVILLCLALTGCGFHLRGMAEIPPWLTNVTIMGDGAQVPLSTMTRSYLEGYHIHVNPDPSTAAYWLIINRADYRQQIVSIGASTNPRQYQLILTVNFVLQNNQGRIVVPPQQVVVTRQFTINNDRILGSNAEEDHFIREMRHEAIVQMVNILCRSNIRP
jgi:LPS-assembly lipoprotein